MNIDIESVFTLIFAGNILIALFFTAYLLINKDRDKSIRIYISSRFLFLMMAPLYVLRGKIPDLFAIGVFNVFIFTAHFLEFYSIAFAKRTFNSRHFYRLLVVPILMSLIFISFLSSIENTRIVVNSGLLGLFFTGCSVFLILNQRMNKTQRLAGFLYVIVALSTLIRFFEAAFVNQSLEILANNTVQNVFYSFYLFSTLFWAVIILLILREKDREMAANNQVV
ncbi:hypothetical protein ACUNWD_09290 [Sunxiuqinia sp. A32]|uniref:hypothetical protein n=1 Tax=Sunxiuqinia sp. A32 TaxID=3461496 RepID=UPI0040451F24